MGISRRKSKSLATIGEFSMLESTINTTHLVYLLYSYRPCFVHGGWEYRRMYNCIARVYAPILYLGTRYLGTCGTCEYTRYDMLFSHHTVGNGELK